MSLTKANRSYRSLKALKPGMIIRNVCHIPSRTRVAVLYQACEPPVVNGVQKPKKPGGYQDSGADIAFCLQTKDIEVVSPEKCPSPLQDHGWCFPDTESGILDAIGRGANTLWANTILFADHPIQTSTLLANHSEKVRVVGQPPRLVEQYDDKNYVNNLLRSDKSFTLPRSWIADSSGPETIDFSTLPYPIVGKPIRGRGSHGVKLCQGESELRSHVSALFNESPIVMLEEYLAGEEATVTVMPPSDEDPRYRALPIVVRFNHEQGIAPYNGIVAVTSNSRVPSPGELTSDPRYAQISDECERIASLLRVTAPIRVDVRRFDSSSASQFAAFDVNMKPNMTGPGRPGREHQASLTAMAAAALGWNYPSLLIKMLASAMTLKDLRSVALD